MRNRAELSNPLPVHGNIITTPAKTYAILYNFCNRICCYDPNEHRLTSVAAAASQATVQSPIPATARCFAGASRIH